MVTKIVKALPRAGRALAVLAIVGVFGAMPIAQTNEGKIAFRDKAGNMTIRNYTGWSLDVVDANTIAFRGTGKPLMGSWTAQKLNMRANSANGTATKNSKGVFELAVATFEGNVALDLKRQSAASETEMQEIHVQAGRATYTESEQKVVASGGVSVKSTDEPAKLTTTMSGPSATIFLSKLDAKGSSGVKSADVTGGVKFSRTGVRKVGDGGPSGTRKIELRSYKIQGRANRLEFRDAERTITLIGDVQLNGNDVVLDGEVEANRAVIRLNASGDVVGIDLEGDPGKTTLRDGKLGNPPGRKR